MDATTASAQRILLRRWLKFSSVGALGIGVQLAVLSCLVQLGGMSYLAATTLAVEVTIVHNFLWHERWTWADRLTSGGRGWIRRLVQFNLTTGAASIAGNLLFMRLFVGTLGIHFLVANLMTIATCSILNFLASDRLVFQPNLWEGDTTRAAPRRDSVNGQSGAR